MRISKRRYSLVVAMLGLAVIATPARAFAADGATDSPGSRYQSTLTTSTGVVRSSVRPNAPSGALIHCNKFYSFSDGNGTYTIQHACGGATAPWSFKISSGNCAIATSAVTEAGMSWTRNGVTQPRQSPHVVPCDYLIHGTYNPARDYDRITYSDTMTFRFSNGTATLNIHGDFTLLGSPCSPTSC